MMNGYDEKTLFEVHLPKVMWGFPGITSPNMPDIAVIISHIYMWIGRIEFYRLVLFKLLADQFGRLKKVNT